MGLAKYTPKQEIKNLQAKIEELEKMELKGWVARMHRHYEIKKLKNRIKEIQKL